MNGVIFQYIPDFAAKLKTIAPCNYLHSGETYDIPCFMRRLAKVSTDSACRVPNIQMSWLLRDEDIKYEATEQKTFPQFLSSCGNGWCWCVEVVLMNCRVHYKEEGQTVIAVFYVLRKLNIYLTRST